MKLSKIIVALLIVIALLAWGGTAFFIVETSQSAILARFNRPLEHVYQPGLHFKAPWPIDSVYRFDKRILVFSHRATEFLTQDKKNILVDSFAVWKIDDEHKFLAKVRNRDVAEILLLEMITAAMGEVIGKFDLSNFISTEEDQVRIADINGAVVAACAQTAKRDYGLTIIDVRINRFNFPLQNRSAVIQRMQAERERIATRYRGEGEEEALKIEAATELETRKIIAEAKKEAEVIIGQGEATAIKIYGEAYAKDPEFYEFMRTLEAYDRIIDSDTTLVLPTDSPLWSLIEKGAP